MMYGFIYPRRPNHKLIVHTFPTYDRRNWLSHHDQREALCGHFVTYSWTWRWHLVAEISNTTFHFPYDPPYKECVKCQRMRIVMDMAS